MWDETDSVQPNQVFASTSGSIFFLMGFSGIGVAIKVVKHEKFQCACLGTFLKVPLTKVTLIEDFSMAIMALLMVFLHTMPASAHVLV